jgi:hypothetical protein
MAAVGVRMVLSGVLARNPKLYWQKGAVGGCNYRWTVVCATMGTAAGRWKVDAMDKGRESASLLTGHQDHTPNSDAARLRLDHPSWHLGASHVLLRPVAY